MATPLQVKEMYQFCEELMKKGYGDKYCYVTTDEEGNDYRPMWFKPTTNTKQIKSMMEYSMSGLNGHDPRNIVLFG
jgi:hypothetical protein